MPERISGRAKVAWLGGEDDVAGQRDLQAAAAADAVHGRDDGLVEAGKLLQAPEAAHAVVAVHGVAARRRLEVPAGAEELLARPREDRHAEVGVVAEGAEGLAHDAGGGEVHGVGLGAVEGDLEDVALAAGADGARSWGLQSDQGVHGDGARGTGDEGVHVEFEEAGGLGLGVGGDGLDGVEEGVEVGGGLAPVAVEERGEAEALGARPGFRARVAGRTRVALSRRSSVRTPPAPRVRARRPVGSRVTPTRSSGPGGAISSARRPVAQGGEALGGLAEGLDVGEVEGDGAGLGLVGEAEGLEGEGEAEGLGGLRRCRPRRGP